LCPSAARSSAVCFPKPDEIPVMRIIFFMWMCFSVISEMKKELHKGFLCEAQYYIVLEKIFKVSVRL
jgi:hypothetical protein